MKDVGDWHVRDALPVDAAALEGLIKQLGFTASAVEIACSLEPVAAQGGRVLVADLAGRVVGCLTTAVMQAIHRPAKVGRIAMLVVDEAHRGCGIGRRLVQAAENALDEDGCYLIEVTSRFDLEQAHHFYEALGYEKTSVRLARQLP